MGVTIKDIVKISGFGLGTVSRVLNGQPGVKDETRERILDVARRLDYKPNKMAKMLVSGYNTNSTIGIILPKITHKFSLKILQGIYTYINDKGYSLLIFNVGTHRNVVFQQIMYADFAGLLSLIDPLTEEEKSMLRDHNNDFIYLDLHENDENSIFFDNHYGGSLAADYLLEKGCKKIVFIGDLSESQQEKERFSGFQKRLHEFGLNVINEYSIEYDENEAYELTKKIINDSNADGIFFYCDVLALGGIKAKKELSSEIRMIGYDDISPTEYVDLSTVRQDAEALGKLGAEKIVELIERRKKRDEKPIYICMKPEIIDRGS